MEFDLAAGSMNDMIGEDNFNPDKLHPDLLPYYEEKAGRLNWPMLRHPLVFQVPFYSWKMANAQYEMKTQKIHEYTQEKNWHGVLAMVERPYRINWLSKLPLEGKELSEILSEWWTDAELPVRNYGKLFLLKLFKRAGFTTDSPITQAELPETLHVYRGTNSERYQRSLSWTKSPAMAAWFARRYAGTRDYKQGVVYEADVPREAVLGIFTGRGEDEVVVDYRKIGKITVCERVITKLEDRKPDL